MIIDVGQAVGDVERKEGAKGGDEEEKQEKEKEENKGVSNKEETMDNTPISRCRHLGLVMHQSEAGRA